ncbi:hypothetical protein SKAU_G00189690 [Synaphobranchus kaupii]|uniref:ribonuclease H n=1 Tax=Synaphobranchus kaupii TaxID=118154 RepID=A0A9Q1FD71_SYNKA|nr:hypothetical protein SKAU_G00189690 [Synaphobranchus kaupii]
MVYMDQASHSSRVMLKVIPVQLRNGRRTLNTHAVLEDSLELTILLPAAAQHLSLKREEDLLTLRTIKQDVVKLRGGPVAVCTQLGWAIQGPTNFLHHPTSESSCLNTSLVSSSPSLYQHVERLWHTLEKGTVHLTVDGILRYATPLLRKKLAPSLYAAPTAVIPLLRATEHHLANSPELASVYNQEIHKLVESSYAVKITSEEASQSNSENTPSPSVETYAPCSTRSGSSQVISHFLWQDMTRDRNPDIYEWRVLPFGTVCSPCSAVYALQRHVRDNSTGSEDVLQSVLITFYVDNCLQPLPSQQQAKQLIDKMRALLAAGGFEIRQWVSNTPEVISHLPTEARSEGCELWLTADKADPQESTQGLRWHCPTDTLGYKLRLVTST